MIKKYFPILEWLPNYKKELISGDLTAGLTVGIMLIPQGMAYAMLAGLPPIYGLYASTIPLIIYAIFGTSRQLAVGPVAMVSLLVASGVGSIATIGTESFISLTILLALMVGLIQLVLGLFKLGFLVNFLSHPVISGFTSAAALIIGFSQLKHLFGFDIPRGKVHEVVLNIIYNLDAVNLPSLMIGMGSIIIILALRNINKRIPSPLIVVILGVFLVYYFGLDGYGVKIIKEIPSGLPKFQIPSYSADAISSLIPIAITISVISYMESFAVAKAIQSKHKDYEIDPNQELIGLGATNIVGSLFSSFPVTGGFSRTAVNNQAGARTGFAAIISALIVLITLLFLTSYFYFLPKAVLAAIILVAVFGLIDIKEARHLWETDKLDFATFMITAIFTLIVGIEAGILMGVIFSILLVLYRISYPNLIEVALFPDSNTFRNVSRFNNLKTFDKHLIIRFDAQLFFGNCQAFKQSIMERIALKKDVDRVIIEAAGIHHIDSSAIHMLKDLYQELKLKNIQLQFADVKGPIRDIFSLNGIYYLIGKSNFFLSVKDAIEPNHETKNTIQLNKIQTNNPINQKI